MPKMRNLQKAPEVPEIPGYRPGQPPGLRGPRHPLFRNMPPSSSSDASSPDSSPEVTRNGTNVAFEMRN